MAKIKLGTVVVGIRGALGGTIYSANAAGPYARAWARPTHERTQKQQQARRRYALAGAQWRALTSGQRAAWDTFAADPAQEQFDAFGDSYYLSGFQWYRKTAIELATAGRAAATSPPTGGKPPAPTISNLQAGPSPTNSFTLVYPTDEFDGYDMIVFAGVRSSAGSITAPPGMRFLAATQSPGSEDTDFFNEAATLFGQIQAGRLYFAAAARQTTDGYRSALTIISDET